MYKIKSIASIEIFKERVLEQIQDLAEHKENL